MDGSHQGRKTFAAALNPGPDTNHDRDLSLDANPTMNNPPRSTSSRRICATLRLAVAGIAILGGHGATAANGQPMRVVWSNVTQACRGTQTMAFVSTVLKEQGQDVLQVSATPLKTVPPQPGASSTAYARMPIRPVPRNADGISFEFKGDGSPQYASVFVGEHASLFNAYEAIFPLATNGWQTMTLRWTDFVKNDPPWETGQTRFSETNVVPAPEALRFIGFGQGGCFNKFYTSHFNFEIRNIRILDDLPQDRMPAYSAGLARTRNLIENGKPLQILLLGDSITDFGGDANYGFQCGQLLKQRWHVDARVYNAGIGGHSVRAGTIVLPRSLRAMPDPDLVCILYGANDCKAVNDQAGYNEAVFARNLEMLIDQVRRGTKGTADIMLLSGVPRLDKNMQSAGTIEKIIGACKRVASERQTAFCDTFPLYLALPEAEKKKVYRDTIHQTPQGQVFLGELLFMTIAADLQQFAKP